MAPEGPFVDGFGEEFFVDSSKYGDYGAGSELTMTHVVTGVVLIVTGIVASAAFAVGARRQLCTLGLLSASGAPPAALRRAVVFQGTVTGAVASVVGGALGVVGAALNPWLDDLTRRDDVPLRVHPLDVIVPIAIGIAAATAAAWLPARHASRIPVLAALAGRQPAGRVAPAVPVAGAVAVALGTAALGLWARQDSPPWGVGLGAAVVVLLGATALAPWVVSHTEALAGRLRGGGRVAARGLARHRVRSAAVVAAVMAPAGLSMFATSVALTSDARDRAVEVEHADDRLADDEVLVTHVGAPPDEVDHVLSVTREALPGAEQLAVQVAVPGPVGANGDAAPWPHVTLEIHDPATGTFGPDDYRGFASRTVIVATTEGLRRLGVPDPTVDALAAGKVVVFDAVGLDAPVPLVGTPAPFARGDVAADPMSRVPNGSQVALISPETASRWGVETLEYATLFRAPADLTDAQQAAVRSATDSDPDEELRRYLLEGEYPSSYVYAQVGGEYGASSRAFLPWAAAGASLVFTLLVVAAALALDATESADERSLLAAIGAPPRVRRSIAAWQAFLLPALGALVAVPIGMVVSYAVLSRRPPADASREVAVQLPWATAALLLIVVPLATAGITWLAAALQGRRRRDLATMALAAD